MVEIPLFFCKYTWKLDKKYYSKFQIYYIFLIFMKPEELQKLLKLTAIELPEDQKPAFLDYFNSMKAMFDDFASFPLPEWDIDVEDDEPITCFTDQKDFDWLDLVETNVIPDRQVNHAIQVNSAIWEE